jgi:hypothetical protein
MHDFTICNAAGIKPGVVAKLIGVSRVTASQWCNGHAQPHRLLDGRVQEFLAIVHAAVDWKMLPLTSYPGRKNLIGAVSQKLVEAAKKRHDTKQAETAR